MLDRLGDDSDNLEDQAQEEAKFQRMGTLGLDEDNLNRATNNFEVAKSR